MIPAAVFLQKKRKTPRTAREKKRPRAPRSRSRGFPPPLPGDLGPAPGESESGPPVGVVLKIKQGGQTASFGPCFHLGFQFGTGFLSRSQKKGDSCFSLWNLRDRAQEGNGVISKPNASHVFVFFSNAQAGFWGQTKKDSGG